MNRCVVGLLSSIFVLPVLAACGGGDAVPGCVEGSTQACMCPGGGSGAQICLVGGRFGTCDCGDPPDAGPRDAAVDVDAVTCSDDDGDGHTATGCGGDDCDDTDATRYPSATEICDFDDEDCNDTTYGRDADSDGFESSECCQAFGNCGPDCDDSGVNINPDATEMCNGGIDDDCNGLSDLADGVCVPCDVGYTGFDGECTDINECLAGAPCGAAAGAACVNDPPGSYACDCPAGYRAPMIGGTCTDIDECAEGTCGPGVRGCVNSAGSYTCTCESGFRVSGTGAPCVDVDECAPGGMAVCEGVMGDSDVGTCANSIGSYVCTCIAGYEAPATGGTCLDINECVRGTDDCDDAPDACIDMVGGFTCICPAGSSGAGRGASGCIVQFTDLGNGTVRDNTTGLVWQQGFSPGTQNQAASASYCGSLTLAGGGWRLPTRDELLSIVDTRFAPATINGSFFPGTPWFMAYFWSSSPGASLQGWIVSFGFGIADQTVVATDLYARCVR